MLGVFAWGLDNGPFVFLFKKVVFDDVTNSLQQVAVLLEDIFQHHIGGESVFHIAIVAGVLFVVEHPFSGLALLLAPNLQILDHTVHLVNFRFAVRGCGNG